MSIEIHGHGVSLCPDDIILYLDRFDVSVSSIIKEFDGFGSLSGCRMNWSKSALMPIDNVGVDSSIPSFVPIGESFICLGIAIYGNIHGIARDNFGDVLVGVGNDIQGWKNLGVSLRGGISTVGMNLLPRFDFFFSLCCHFLPLQVALGRSTPWFLGLSGVMNVPELDLPHCNILVAQEDWLYQVLNRVVGRSSLGFFMVGLVLSLQFHGG